MLVVGLLYILKPVDNKKKNCDDAVPIARLFMFTNLTRSLNVSNVFLSLAKNYEIWNEPHQYAVIKIRLCVSVPQLMPDYLMLLSHTHFWAEMPKSEELRLRRYHTQDTTN